MQVSSSYPQATASFAPELMDLLDKHHAVLEPPLRQVGALPPGFVVGINWLAHACCPTALRSVGAAAAPGRKLWHDTSGCCAEG